MIYPSCILCCIFIHPLIFVFRWRRCGDSRGGCWACRAWYQWVVHWYVWKDGHLPARGTDRCFNILHTSSFCQIFPAYRKTYILSQHTHLLVFIYTSVFLCHAYSPHVLTCSGTCEDYRLLENMNKLTSLKYMEMKDISINISRNLQDLNNKCEWDILSAQNLSHIPVCF